MADSFTDAIALLKADHREVEDLFEQFEKTKSASKKQAIARQICTELKIHTLIEEELFYPAFRGKIEDDTLDEAYVEHDGAKVLINDIEAGSPDDDFYDAKVKVLSEEIKHHVHEGDAVGGHVRAVPQDRRRSRIPSRPHAGAKIRVAGASRIRRAAAGQANGRQSDAGVNFGSDRVTRPGQCAIGLNWGLRGKGC
jgi:hypothetical protein